MNHCNVIQFTRVVPSVCNHTLYIDDWLNTISLQIFINEHGILREQFAKQTWQCQVFCEKEMKNRAEIFYCKISIYWWFIFCILLILTLVSKVVILSKWISAIKGRLIHWTFWYVSIVTMSNRKNCTNICFSTLMICMLSIHGYNGKITTVDVPLKSSILGLNVSWTAKVMTQQTFTC